MFIIGIIKSYSLSIIDLVDYAIEYNSDIKTSLIAYETESLSCEKLNGYYIPGISLNSTVKLSDESNDEKFINYLDSNISCTQSFPGGTLLSFSMDYNLNNYNLFNDIYISQTPNITLKVSQSLFPFWLQGAAIDPVKLSYYHSKDYYYYQFLNTKKIVLIQIFQNYVMNLISKNEMAINKNLINLYVEQIESLNELCKKGNVSQSKILEVENLKWNAQQNYMINHSNSIGYIQKLKTICGFDFDEGLLDDFIENDFENKLSAYMDKGLDPLEKIYELKIKTIDNSRTLEKQTSAPVLNIGVGSAWNLDMVKKNNWQSAWNDFSEPTNWSLSFGINFSPLFSDMAKHSSEKYNLEKNDSIEKYNLYLQQRKFVKNQYEILLSDYKTQFEIIYNLYNNALLELNDYKFQYETGMISELDLDSFRVRVENYCYSKDCIELYIKMYNFLLSFA